eukprot:TRINITY_DN2212_c0_g1_i1.p1 TRINITY_DN2212_c0_g1~~TRINITY_DN2212_c0_g1_i1.p1  ORF type:complete len:458 (+),score=125.70 TRINITY_DN2212_c0_g1_i1:147-1520(+)
MDSPTREEMIFFKRYFVGTASDLIDIFKEEEPELQNFVVSSCGLCRKDITVSIEEDPDQKVDYHIDFECGMEVSKPKNLRRNNSSVIETKTEAISPILQNHETIKKEPQLIQEPSIVDIGTTEENKPIEEKELKTEPMDIEKKENGDVEEEIKEDEEESSYDHSDDKKTKDSDDDDDKDGDDEEGEEEEGEEEPEESIEDDGSDDGHNSSDSGLKSSKKKRDEPKISVPMKKANPRRKFCIICLQQKDHHRSVTHPKEMTTFFAEYKGFDGNLRRTDKICRQCYSSFFSKRKSQKSEKQASKKKKKQSRKLIKCNWVGEPIYTEGPKSVYSAVSLNDTEYTIGEPAQFTAPDGAPPYIGKITSLFQVYDQMYVQCEWYFAPSQTNLKLKEETEGELFESQLKDDNSIGSIERKVTILTMEEYMDRKKKKKKMDHIYFCRQRYDPKHKRFLPLRESIK